MNRAFLFLAFVGLSSILTGCSESSQPAAGPTEEPHVRTSGEGDLGGGGELFAEYCASCHGLDAAGSALGPTLVSEQVAAQDQAYFHEIIAKGRPGTSMPAWDGLLSPQQIEDVIAFLRTKQ